MERFALMFFWLAFLAFPSWAQVAGSLDCSEVRLDQENRSMSRLGIHDQRPANLCYAHTVSQLVDAWRFSNGDTEYGHITSPQALGVFLKAGQWWRKEFEPVDIGEVETTMELLRKHGSCSARVIEEKFGSVGLKNYYSGLMTIYREYKANPHGSDLAPIWADTVDCFVKKSASVATPDPNIEEIIKALNHPTYTKFLAELIKPVCEQNTKKIQNLPPMREFVSSKLKKSERDQVVPKKIHELLARPNAQPIGMNLCIEIIKDKSKAALHENGEKSGNKCELIHSALIIGKRPGPNGKCEYLMRNSEGENCNDFPQWKDKCERGQLWLDHDSLLNNLYFMYWLGEE